MFKKALVLDDEPQNLTLVQGQLKILGFEALPASDLETAMHKAAGNPGIDLVLSDIDLGNGKNGFDIITALRTVLNGQTKFGLMSGNHYHAERAKKEADFFLPKPYKLAELREKLGL